MFGRVTPDQKRQFIRALKKAGHTVAMTGDGVNDVLALKDADCSVAMASGSDAAAHVSDLVLLNSDFSAMPSVVDEGRRVINNIERSASLFLVKNIFSFFLTLIAIITGALYPFKPVQLSLTSAVMIGIPSFFLALEPNHDLVKGKFLRNVLFRAFPAALASVIVVEGAILFANAFDITREMISTVAFYLFSFVSYMMLYRVCKPMTILHRALFITMGGLYFLAISLLPSLLNIVPLTYGCALILAALIFIAYVMDRFILYVFQNFGSWKNSVLAYLAKDNEKHKSSSR